MQTARDDQPRNRLRWLFSLDPFQWVLLGAGVFIAAINVAAAVLDPDPFARKSVSHVLSALGWPLFTWGMLPRMRIAGLAAAIREFFRRDLEAIARRLSPTHPTSRDWCTHIGFTFVFGGMALFFPVVAFQIAAAALLVLYWAGVITQLRAAQKRPVERDGTEHLSRPTS